MTPAITLPPIPIRDPFDNPDAPAHEASALAESLREYETYLNALEESYNELCHFADEHGDLAAVDDSIQALWDRTCQWMALDQRRLARCRQWPPSRSRDLFVSAITREMERLADLMRTITVVWEELELETPEEIYEAVWTIRIAPLAYLRAMWNLFWSSIRHPLSTTVIELKTGRILRTE